jgi:O-antigen/teichoic acid export membrane protein
MSEHVEKSVGIVLKGSLVTLLGMIISTISWFASKVIITRATNPEVFGVYSLCYSITTFAYILSTLGLSVGIARYIPYYIGRSEKNKAQHASLIALKVGSLLSILIFAVLFFFSNLIATNYFRHIHNFSFYLKLIFVTIPFYAVLDLVIGVARGYGNIVPKVYFLDCMRNGLFLILILLALPLGLSTSKIIFVYVISVIFPSIISYFYLSKTYKADFFASESAGVSLKEMLKFSLPLMFIPVMWLVLGTMDTIMLGYYKAADEVGIYNASASLAKICNALTTPVAFIFLPVATQFYAKKSFTEMSLLYEIFNKWIFSISLPFFGVLLFFPEVIITKLFGIEYMGGALCLKITTLGYLSILLFGMNNVTLTASGLSMKQMLLSVFTIVLNVVLNILLIPKYGMNGAAVATALSLTVFNVLSSMVLCRYAKVHPFSLAFFKTVFAAIISGMLFFLIAQNIKLTLYHIPFYLILFTFSYFFFLIIFRAINKYDLIILDLIERKTGIHFAVLRRFINWIAVTS